VLRFAVSLQRYLWSRGRSEEGLGLLAPVLEVPDTSAEPELLVRALVTLIFMARNVDAALAKRLAERALRIARPLDNPPLLAEALAWLCCACYFTGDYEEGFPLGAEAVALARTLGDDVFLGQSLLMFLLCSHRVDPAPTEALITEALGATRRSGDQYITMFVRNNAGVYALEAGDMAAARAHLEEARQATPTNAPMTSNILVNLGWVEREEGNPEDAISKFQDGLRTSRRNGDHAGSAYASLGLACLAADRGDWSQGATLHGISQAIFDRTGEKCQEPEDTYRRRSIAAARAQLGEEEFERLYTEGRISSFDDAVDLALGTVRA
jgi:tetratricopeptide (TPR) repeat protein